MLNHKNLFIFILFLIKNWDKFKVCATDQEKLVTRLSILFFDEDPDKFKIIVNQYKYRQQIVEAEIRFKNLVDSLPTDSISILSKYRRFYFLQDLLEKMININQAKFIQL